MSTSCALIADGAVRFLSGRLTPLAAHKRSESSCGCSSRSDQVRTEALSHSASMMVSPPLFAGALSLIAPAAGPCAGADAGGTPDSSTSAHNAMMDLTSFSPGVRLRCVGYTPAQGRVPGRDIRRAVHGRGITKEHEGHEGHEEKAQRSIRFLISS